MPARTVPRADQRARLLEVALRLLEESGPEVLQARRLTSEIGTSTQAVYTLFGGMPGLFDALVADGFERFARFVDEVPETDDPVADFFTKGGAYCQWAFEHPQLYRLMFGLTAGRLRGDGVLEMTVQGHVMVHSLDRVKAAGRIRDQDTVIAAGQFLSATHGYVLLQIGGAFGEADEGLQVLAPLAVNLMVGLGDDREAAERSLQAAFAVTGAAAGSPRGRSRRSRG